MYIYNLIHHVFRFCLLFFCLSQDILPDDLPQLFQHDGQRENPRSKLTSTTELCAAAVLHRKIHTVEMEHKAKVNEILGEDDVCRFIYMI